MARVFRPFLLLGVLSLTGLLGGCIAYPAYPGGGGYYAQPYYPAPVVGVGVGWGGYGRHHRGW